MGILPKQKLRPHNLPAHISLHRSPHLLQHRIRYAGPTNLQHPRLLRCSFLALEMATVFASRPCVGRCDNIGTLDIGTGERRQLDAVIGHVPHTNKLSLPLARAQEPRQTRGWRRLGQHPGCWDRSSRFTDV